MTIASGNLDSLVGTTGSAQIVAELSYVSGTTIGSGVSEKVASVTATKNSSTPTIEKELASNGSVMLPTSITITKVNDSDNTILIDEHFSQIPLGLSSPDIVVSAYVVGYNGQSLLIGQLNSNASAFEIDAGVGADLDWQALSLNGTSPNSGTWTQLSANTLSVSAALVAKLSEASQATISDSAANVQANFDALRPLAGANDIASITLTDSGVPSISITRDQLSNDSGVVSTITGSYKLNITNVFVQDASSTLALPHVTSISIADSAGDVAGTLDILQSLAISGKLTTIALTDTGVPTLSITAAQLTSDAAALNDISGSYNLTIAAGSSAVSIAGLTGHATTVQFSGDASQYTIGTANGTVNVTSGGVTDTLSNIAAIQFADVTEIVAAPPGSANAVTTGNVTELYSAVLAREPDVGGLIFYQNFLKANPLTPLVTFAEYFLNSPEYTSAHNYAQSTAGDEQFITDSYQNLLHRTPSAAEVSFYETNVLAPAVANLTPGTAAYANAALQAHALMLVYFSASAEFLTDVQVTATNPASAQHWLVLT